MIPAMTNSHRLFLQAFMSQGIVCGKDVRNIYQTCCERFNEPFSMDQLAQFVNVINSNIKPLHMEIRKGVGEDTGVKCYGLVNTTENDVTRLASDYTIDELELFKKLVESIVESDTGTVSSIIALNLADTLTLQKKMTKQDAESMFKRMIQDKWLVKNRDGHYALATRAILELDHYIQQQFPDIVNMCGICKNLVLQGQTCEHCGTRLHLYCASRFFKDMQPPKCPKRECGVEWIHPIPQLSKASSKSDVPQSQSGVGTSRGDASQAETSGRLSRKRVLRD